MLASFKHKLALYFLVLAVLPLAAAFWGFGTLAKRAEERRVDTRLEAELRAVFASYDHRIGQLEARAHRLAGRPEIQQALTGGRRLVVGRRATLEATRTVRVRKGQQTIGSILAVLPLDRALLRDLRSDTGLARGDRIVFVPVAKARAGRLHRLAPAQPLAVSLAGSRYRALATAPLAEQPSVQLALLAPGDAIEAAAASTRRHLLYVLLGGLVLLAAIAAAEGRSIMRSVRELALAARAIGKGRLNERVPVRGRDEFADLAGSFNAMADQLRTRLLELELERTRLRDSLSRTGELLTATHDADQLLTVIASAAQETADAEGVVLISEQGVVVELGTIADDAVRYELPVVTGDSRFGILILYAGGELRDDDLVAARALVAQAAVALENARLHEVVEQRAISDGLTGLSNRRHCEERLADEIARSERYGAPLALIICDIDEFKAANDTHGHAFGDLVLREFAGVLGETLRDVDVSGRWGGEEFLIVLPGTSLEGAVEAAERIRSDFAALELSGGAGPVRMTASFGVASFVPGTEPDQLVRAADEALYEAKRRGKDRVRTALVDSVKGVDSLKRVT
jgi:diguanylate cyclase (GGDEF)-like protein